MEVITGEDPVGATPSLMYGVHCELTESNRMLTNRRGIPMKRVQYHASKGRNWAKKERKLYKQIEHFLGEFKNSKRECKPQRPVSLPSKGS